MKNIILFEKLNKARKYQIKYTAILATVPVLCSFVLLLLLFVFAKLNLYYLESLGLIINPEIRTAYYDQINIELTNVFPYLGALYFLSCIVCWIVMNWAISPFRNAEKRVKKFLENADSDKQGSAWLSENHTFDTILTEFLTLTKNKELGTPGVYQEKRVHLNIPFLSKFIFIFILFSILNAFILGIVLDATYNKIVSLALNILPGNKINGHYFTAQDEILNDGVKILMSFAVVVYAIIGSHISRYMATMLFVFGRYIKEQRFPIRLREADIYGPLADLISKTAESGKK